MYTDDQLTPNLVNQNKINFVKRLTKYDPYASKRIDFYTLATLSAGASAKTLQELLGLSYKDAKARNVEDRECFLDKQYRILNAKRSQKPKVHGVRYERSTASSRGRVGMGLEGVIAPGDGLHIYGGSDNFEDYTNCLEGCEEKNSLKYKCRDRSLGQSQSERDLAKDSTMLFHSGQRGRGRKELDGFRTVFHEGRCALDPGKIPTKTPGPAYDYKPWKIVGGSSFGKSRSKRMSFGGNKKKKKKRKERARVGHGRGRTNLQDNSRQVLGQNRHQIFSSSSSTSLIPSSMSYPHFFGGQSPDVKERWEAEMRRQKSRQERRQRRQAEQQKTPSRFQTNPSRKGYMISSAKRYVPLMFSSAENVRTIPQLSHLRDLSPGPRYNLRMGPGASRNKHPGAIFGRANRAPIFDKTPSPGPVYSPRLLATERGKLNFKSGRGIHGSIHEARPGQDSPGPMYFACPSGSFRAKEMERRRPGTTGTLNGRISSPPFSREREKEEKGTSSRQRGIRSTGKHVLSWEMPDKEEEIHRKEMRARIWERLRCGND